MKSNKFMAILALFGLILLNTAPVWAEDVAPSTNFAPGCTSDSGYSDTTGESCGCNGTNYSTYNGQACPTTPAYNIIIDSILEDTGVSDSDHITNNNTPMFTGTSSLKNSEIVFQYYPSSLSGAFIADTLGSTISDENGNWTFQTSSVIADGDYIISGMVPSITDGYGLSNNFNFTIDKHADTPTAILSISMDTGTSSTDLTTNDNTLVFSGTSSATENIKIYIYKGDPNVITTPGGNLIGEPGIDESGNWTFDYTGKVLDDGYYQITLGLTGLTDLAGNVMSYNETWPTFIDTTAPEAPVIISPVSGPYNGTPEYTVTGTCDPEVDHLNFTFEPLEIETDELVNKIGNNYAYDTPCTLEGTFSTSILMAGEEGFAPLKFGAVQLDKAGNMSPVSNIVTISRPQGNSGGGSSTNDESTGGGSSGGGGGGAILVDFLKNPVSNIVAINSTDATKVTSDAAQNPGKVLGTSTTCPKFTKYIKLGADNDKNEVKMWQTFLNESQGENLVVDGIYGPLTFAAVNRFQEKYTDEVLKPWNTVFSTGFIYITTTKMANKLNGC